MSDHENDAVRSSNPRWPAVRTVLLIGLGVVIGAFAVWLGNRPEPKISDRYYMVMSSIAEAKNLAQVLHLKSSDRSHPILLWDLHGWSEGGFKDAWGKPFRCAAVAGPAGNDPDIYVWTDWAQEDGRVTLIGARVSADGTSTLFGRPPND